MLSHSTIMSSFFKLDRSINPTSFNCFADPELVFLRLITCSITDNDELFLRTIPEAFFTHVFMFLSHHQ